MGFSVLMSVYCKEKPEYLKQAFESLLSQTLLPDEVVLIKDGPLPEALEAVVADYKERFARMVVFAFEENVQLGRALAKGVDLCSQELIARMDTDDIALPERFAHQYEFMRQHPEVSVVGGWMEEFNDEETYQSVKRMPERNEEIRRYGRYRNPVNHMTVMMRKDDVLRAGNYQHFPNLEDYELWSRMLADGMVFYNLPEVLVRMRNNSDVYERRGGIAYARNYFALRREQRAIGRLTRGEYLVSLCLTFGITLQPGFLRKLIYRRLLRK